MLHVPQRFGNDCGLATASMVSATSYRIVTAIFSRLALLDKGLGAVEMRKLLEVTTRSPWHMSWPCGLARVCNFKLLAGPAALLIEGENYQHWVAINDGIVHDPAFPEAVTVDQYRRNQWTVNAFLRQGW